MLKTQWIYSLKMPMLIWQRWRSEGNLYYSTLDSRLTNYSCYILELIFYSTTSTPINRADIWLEYELPSAMQLKSRISPSLLLTRKRFEMQAQRSPDPFNPSCVIYNYILYSTSETRTEKKLSKNRHTTRAVCRQWPLTWKTNKQDRKQNWHVQYESPKLLTMFV